MRLAQVAIAIAACLIIAPAVRAEYFVLRSGQRLSVTGYQLTDGKYRLQMTGGFVEVAADEVTAIEPEDVFTSIRPAAAIPAGQYRDLIQAAAEQYKVDADLITSVIAAESNFNPKAISRRNARGLMQLLPETAAQLGVHNIFDPKENIDAGTRYLRDLLERYKNDLVLTLAAYNAGPERVQQYGRVPPYSETIFYVRRVKRAYDKRKAVSRESAKPAKVAALTSAAGSSTATK